jgi:gliding motility-associated-like protein
MPNHLFKYLICAVLFFWLVTSGFQSSAQCAACQHQVQLITNGNFSSGNSGFSTSLSPGTGLFCPLCPENTYAVGTNAFFYHNGFTGTDHTNPPNGNFFIANGAAAAGADIWCQSFAVQSNTEYTFTFWARDVTNNSDPHPQAWLRPVFNGLASADSIIAISGWHEYTTIWNSGESTFLELCIQNNQWQGGGNDFGLDDISFSACEAYNLSQNAFAGIDQEICGGENLTLGAITHSGYNYSWTESAGLSNPNIAQPIFSMYNDNNSPVLMTYILAIDSANVGCIETDTVTISVLPMPEINIGADTAICPGGTIVLEAGLGWDNILWSTGQGVQQIEVNTGSYSLTVELGTCTSSDSIIIAEVDLPVIDLGADTSICENSTLEIDPGYEGIWMPGGTLQAIEITETGNYQFTYFEGSCSVSDAILVDVYTMPNPNLIDSLVICEGQPVTLNAGSVGIWSNGVEAQSILVGQPGYYEVQVSNGPCQIADGTQISMILLPDLNLPENTTICEFDYLRVDASAPQNQYYSWSTGDSTAVVIFNEAGEYSIEISNQCGTVTGGFEIATMVCSSDIFIPTAFTPNGNSVNEGWAVQGYNVSDLKIFVYNRLGDLIYYSEKFGEAWQPGEGVPDDVYNYRVEASDYLGDPIVKLGHIYLLR